MVDPQSATAVIRVPRRTAVAVRSALTLFSRYQHLRLAIHVTRASASLLAISSPAGGR